MGNNPQTGAPTPEGNQSDFDKRIVTRTLNGLWARVLTPLASLIVSLTTAYQTFGTYLEEKEKNEADLLKTIELVVSISWALSSIYSVGMDVYRTFIQASHHALLGSWGPAFGLSNTTKEFTHENVRNNVLKNLEETTLELLKNFGGGGDPKLVEERIKKLRIALSQSLDILAQRAKGMGFAYHTELFSQALAAVSNIAMIGLRFKSDSIDLIGAKIVSLVTTLGKLILVLDNFYAWKARLTNDVSKKFETINDINGLIKKLDEIKTKINTEMTEIKRNFEQNEDAFPELKKLMKDLKYLEALREHLIKLGNASEDVESEQRQTSELIQRTVESSIQSIRTNSETEPLITPPLTTLRQRRNTR